MAEFVQSEAQVCLGHLRLPVSVFAPADLRTAPPGVISVLRFESRGEGAAMAGRACAGVLYVAPWRPALREKKCTFFFFFFFFVVILYRQSCD
jgi:hypothetical protein